MPTLQGNNTSLLWRKIIFKLNLESDESAILVPRAVKGTNKVVSERYSLGLSKKKPKPKQIIHSQPPKIKLKQTWSSVGVANPRMTVASEGLYRSLTTNCNPGGGCWEGEHRKPVAICINKYIHIL